MTTQVSRRTFLKGSGAMVVGLGVSRLLPMPNFDRAAAAAARTVSALEKANIRTVGGLARKKEADLFEIDGLGAKSIQEIKRALANFGIILK